MVKTKNKKEKASNNEGGDSLGLGKHKFKRLEKIAYLEVPQMIKACSKKTSKWLDFSMNGINGEPSRWGTR